MLKQLQWPLVFCALLLGAGCKSGEATREAEQPPMTMEETLAAKRNEARGGFENMQALQTLKWTGSVETMGMSLPFTLYQKRPNMMRSVVMIPQMGAEVVSGFDGVTAWTINPMMGGGAQKLPEEQARQTKEMASIDGPLADYKERGIVLEYMGEVEVRRAAAHQLKLTSPEGPSVLVFLDAETGLEIKQEAEGLNPQTGQMAKVETFLSDYRDVNGVMLPFALEIVIAGGELTQELRLQKVEVNLEMEPALFSFPTQ